MSEWNLVKLATHNDDENLKSAYLKLSKHGPQLPLRKTLPESEVRLTYPQRRCWLFQLARCFSSRTGRTLTRSPVDPLTASLNAELGRLWYEGEFAEVTVVSLLAIEAVS